MTELGRASSERGWIGFALTQAAVATPHIDVYRPQPSDDLTVVRRFRDEILTALDKVASSRDDQAKALRASRRETLKLIHGGHRFARLRVVPPHRGAPP
jgi:hypothetical protein